MALDNKVILDDGEEITLNPSLLVRQGVDAKRLAELKRLHVLRARVIKEMAKEKATDAFALQQQAAEVTRLDFELQKVWGFPQDEAFHYWYDLPHCTCPKMDNRERYGIEGQRIISEDCPIHAKKAAKRRLRARSVDF